MPILPFRKKWKPKLEDGTKAQSIRKNCPHWVRLHKGAMRKGKPLMIWCPGPRFGNGEHLFDRYKWTVTPTYGREFTEEIARRDGFGSVRELVGWLMEAHEMTYEQVLDHRWAVIQWNNQSKGGVE